MPIFDYQSLECGHIIEDVLQRSTEENLKYCPDCGAEDMRKLIGVSNFQLKGDGWYSTDYAKKTKAVHTAPPADGMDATKQSIDKASGSKDSKAVADSISKDVKKARGK